MAFINLYDGTEDQKYGRALRRAFTEIRKYQDLSVSTTPGGIHIPSYSFVKNLESRAHNPERNQVHLSRLLNGFLYNSNKDRRGQLSFILTESDLYDNGLNWCFGKLTPDTKGGAHIIMSTNHVNSSRTLAHLATHEFGHMFSAASRGRSNTEENLGSHCTNLCVMQQQVEVSDMDDLAMRLKSRDDKFCYQCQDELRRYR